MSHRDVRALVLTGHGINCEEETAAAYALAGAEATIVHVSDLLAGRVRLGDAEILHLSGGFSFGDDLGSGRVLATRLRHRKLPSGEPFFGEIQRFLDRGGLVFGVCNGFQALVKMGLLPNTRGRFEQEATLTRNDSGKFEDRWVHCRGNDAAAPGLRGVDLIDLPVRHGEGKLILGDDAVRSAVFREHLVCLTYVDGAGEPATRYPEAPNGAELSAAGLSDPSGQVLGMMPHPEAFLSLYNHPDWPSKRRRDPAIDEEGAGARVFRNLVEHAATLRR
jgi:phosphoribosylformylglycinamidine synthase